MYYYLVCILSLIMLCPLVKSDSSEVVPLRFGDTGSDYISFEPDMSTMASTLSYCAWVKKGPSNPEYAMMWSYYHSGSGTTIFIGPWYNQDWMGDSSLQGTLRSKYDSLDGSWFHSCSTWSSTTGTRVYLNGELVGSSTSSRGKTITAGGTMVIGNYAAGIHSAHFFGGDLSGMNFFNKELSASEISAMFLAGMCGQLIDSVENARLIKWEEIITLERSGNVEDNDEMTNEMCPELAKIAELDEMKSLLKTTQLLLNETSRQFDATKTSLEETQQELNVTKSGLVNTTQELTQTKLDLETTEKQLETSNADLTRLQEECSAAVKVEDSATHWDVLLNEKYLNKDLTSDNLQILKQGWDMLDDFIGTNMTERVIHHFKTYHQACKCEEKTDG